MELGGHGSFYTLNYERIILDIEYTKTSAQIGLAYYPKSTGMIPMWLPVSLNQMLKIIKNQYVEFGVGLMMINDGIEFPDGRFVDNYSFDNLVFRLGYRLESQSGKWVYRAGYTPIYLSSQFGGNELIHWGGVSMGYRF